ncbi:type III secretion protein L [Paraburkholderia sp. HC6.4b]|uniref:FliH/SctL family protein n=1 Tax=unclassified Paraburkholderia TaxID=2615204 RepID=UPI00161182D8|nr:MULTISPECIES: FliH/SctL family protein [unclassified Paraburkholderia]MBB5407680.1 type III secretion protein L [Paraburkholderia sp. HC6.4b]MBB5452307.1 type III secretion protein L [Paraburkholderia sp. Kb1A]
MSLLLKAAQVTLGSGRKTLGRATLVAVAAEPSEHVPVQVQHAFQTDAQIDELRRELAELAQTHAEQIRDFEERERAAYQRGIEEGIEKGVARVKLDHVQRIEALVAGIDAALAALRDRLQEVESLALDVAQAALRKTLGDTTACAALVVQTARHHLAQIAAGSAIGVRVSAKDFPDADALRDAFATLTRDTALTVDADPQLAAGACLIDLTLGRLDVSLPRQLSHFNRTLDELRADD